MTAISDFTSKVNSWLGDRDYSEALVATWVKMAEERFNTSLRISEMIKTVSLPVVSGKVDLPSDWLENEFVRHDTIGSLEVVSNEVFYDRPNKNKFTVIGKAMYTGSNVTGNVVISYFAEVPSFGSTETWLSSKYQTLFLNAVMVAGMAYGIEDARASAWIAFVTDNIDNLNTAYIRSKLSGSTPQMPKRGRKLG